MNERLAKAEALFHKACEVAPQQREAFLRQACGEDVEVLNEVRALLRAAGIADRWLKDSDCAAAALPHGSSCLDSLREGPGTVVGRYKLLEQIGEGGFGAVYMAEQQAPVRRRVALKIIKLGMDTRNVIARFEAERQALALMDHPNIAKVLDAGATGNGRPYFVMELVRGVPMTRFCQEHQLGIAERLELFIQVCGAIQHAHQKGVIHRDIKPTNVLVTLNDGVPHPMLIDFGVAKAINQRLTEKTLFTNFAQMIGTPAYMSPEQAEMSKLDVDTRSDVYSLGVLLYELLTGTTPFPEERLRSAGYLEMQRIICEEKPARPSTRLTRTGGAQTRSPRTRPSPLATDLDWIVMKCLEKDRTRRYETANGLGEDIKRHLDNQPVRARPPSRLYEFQKSVRRHKVGFGAAAALVVALVAGGLASSWQAALARQAERRAKVAQANETRLRRQAQTQELAARRGVYAADMIAVQTALARDDLSVALDLLEGHRPEPGQDREDLRGWEWRYLWGQARSDELFSLDQASDEISALAASADSHWLAVGLNHQGGLAVWNLRTRQRAVRLAEDEERVRAAFSPVAPLVAFTSLKLLPSRQQNSTLHLWNAATREMIREIPLDEECAGLGFSKDGRTLVTSTSHSAQGGRITLWGLPEGTPLVSYTNAQDIFEAATCFAATPDLSLAAYTCESPNQPAGVPIIRVVDLRNGQELWNVVAAKLFVTSLAFSPDGKTLASSVGIGETPVIKLWDVASGQLLKELPGVDGPVFSLVFWPDGKRLASVAQTIQIWDTATGERVDVLRGRIGWARRLALLPDGRTLACDGGVAGKICFYDASVTHPRQPCFTIPRSVRAWCFTSDSHSVLTLDGGGQVAQWASANFQQSEPLLEIGTNFYINGRFNPFSIDGRFLAVGSTNGLLQVWDVAQRRLWHQWEHTGGLIYPVAFGPNGDRLLSYSPSDNSLHEWDLLTGRQLQPVSPPPWANGGAVSPDGRLVVVTDEAGNVWRLNRADGTREKLKPAVLDASDAAFSADGKWLAVSSMQGFARVWNTATWSAPVTHITAVHSVAFSPNGRRLATGGDGDEAVKLWDLQSWRKVLVLKGQGAGFLSTAFSRDGNAIGSMNCLGTLHVWRAPSWDEIAAEDKGASTSEATQTAAQR